MLRLLKEIEGSCIFVEISSIARAKSFGADEQTENKRSLPNETYHAFKTKGAKY